MLFFRMTNLILFCKGLNYFRPTYTREMKNLRSMNFSSDSGLGRLFCLSVWLLGFSKTQKHQKLIWDQLRSGFPFRPLSKTKDVTRTPFEYCFLFTLKFSKKKTLVFFTVCLLWRKTIIKIPNIHVWISWSMRANFRKCTTFRSTYPKEVLFLERITVHNCHFATVPCKRDIALFPSKLDTRSSLRVSGADRQATFLLFRT